jgi:FkbM family methyltransferase
VSGKAAERERRLAYFDAALAETPLLAVESKQGRFVVSTADRRIGRAVFTKGQYAAHHLPQALELLAGLGFPDARSGGLLDIGANIGTVAIPALHRQGMKRAIAFEPHPDNVRLLRMNAIYNGLEDRLDVVACALSDREGSGTLQIVNPDNSGAHEVAEPDARARPGVQTVDIELRTLDGLEAEGRIGTDDITLVWLDVQGHEPHVLGGATRLLTRGVPVVTEFHPTVLRRNGTYDLMAGLVAEHFSSFVDLRDRTDGAARKAVAVDRLPDVAESLGDRFSDLLLVPRRR